MFCIFNDVLVVHFMLYVPRAASVFHPTHNFSFYSVSKSGIHGILVTQQNSNLSLCMLHLPCEKCASFAVGDVEYYVIIIKLLDLIFNVLSLFINRLEIQTCLSYDFSSVRTHAQGTTCHVHRVDRL